MGIFQSAYDFFKNLTAPKWLRDLIRAINDILITILYQVGLDALKEIKEKIITTSTEQISNDEKFVKVFDFITVLLPKLKESVKNLLIEILVSKLKNDFII